MSVPSVFLSHAHSDADAPWVKSFARALEERDVSVFDVDQLRTGGAISDAVERALRGSDAIVVLLDPETAKRPSLLWEIGAGIGMRKRLIPILSEELEPGTLPLPLRNVRSLKRGNPDDTAALVAAAVSEERAAH